MGSTKRRHRGAGPWLIGLGHVGVGVGGLVVAGVLMYAGTRPFAGLGGVAALPAVLLGLGALAFTRTAVRALRHREEGPAVPGWRALALVEIAAGTVLAGAVAVAVQGYGAFEPWRSPLLLPSAVLLALGFAGLAFARDRDPRAEPADRRVA